MIITLRGRVEEFADGDPFIVSHTDDAESCIYWLSGFLSEGVIIDSMKVMG